jgi:hypothetical protein
MAHTPSTAALVNCIDPKFTDANQDEDPDQITMTIDVLFNGHAGRLGDFVTFARNATLATKQAAVRLRVNQLLAAFETGTPTLNNANIQISGLPV